MNYSSVICNYCVCTDYGNAPVNTGPWNICEGQGCEAALDLYNSSCADDEDKIKCLEDAF